MADLYNFSLDEDTGAYTFITKNDIEYKVVFIVDETLDCASEDSIENVYQIVIEKVSDLTAKMDGSIQKTIEQIVSSFFDKIENCLIYTCSDDRNKAEVRFKLFNRWYNNSSLVSTISKVDNIINCGTKQIYTSLMYNNNNPNAEKALIAYKKIEASLNEK